MSESRGGMFPKLKSTVHWVRVDADVRILSEGSMEEIVLADESGSVERFLRLLREGGREIGELGEVLGTSGLDEARQGVAALDGLGLLIDDSAGGLTEWQLDRYQSGLNFFETFASVRQSPAGFQDRLLSGHVVVLGVGGSTAAIMALAGAGAGRMTLLDFDRIERKNLVRQYMFRESDIGRLKVERAEEWIGEFNPEIEVTAINGRISSPADVAVLLAGQPDLVFAAIDQPFAAVQWVNDACVQAGVPYVSGGTTARHARYWSVNPGRSACYSCSQLHKQPPAEHWAGLAGLEAVNRATGPVVSLATGLIAMEALRYLSGYAPPAAAGRCVYVDLVTGEQVAEQWASHPDCPACPAGTRREPAR
jgi:molybdopterin-synthase adenylyltransferase